MAFVPSFKTTNLLSTNEVISLSDPISGITLSQSDNNRLPTFTIDEANRPYLRFDADRLFSNGINISELGGDAGNTTTIVFIADIDDVIRQTPVNWIQGDGPSYDTTTRFSLHLPWEDDTYRFDYSNTATGRTTLYDESLRTNAITTFLYVRNDSTAEVWVDDSLLHTETGLASTLPTENGRFMLGDGFDLGEYAYMNFYALLIYPRALTENEKIKILKYTAEVYNNDIASRNNSREYRIR